MNSEQDKPKTDIQTGGEPVEEGAQQPAQQPGEAPARPRRKGGRLRRFGPRKESGQTQRTKEKAPRSAIRDAIRQVEQIRESLRTVLRQMDEGLKLLEQAEKDKNITQEEIDLLRESLRNLQRGR